MRWICKVKGCAKPRWGACLVQHGEERPLLPVAHARIPPELALDPRDELPRVVGRVYPQLRPPCSGNQQGEDDAFIKACEAQSPTCLEIRVKMCASHIQIVQCDW